MREDLKEWNEENKKLRESWKGTIWEWVTDTPAIYEIAKTWYCPQREEEKSDNKIQGENNFEADK